MSTPTGAAGGTCIDIHGHGVPREFLEEVKRSRLGGVTVDVDQDHYRLQFPGEQPLRPVAGVMMDYGDERLGWLDRQGVSTQMVAPWLDVHGQQLPSSVGAEWAQLLNDTLADAVARTDGRVRAHATLHLADPTAAAAELERAHRDLGMTGCMIPTNLPERFLDEPAFDALWEAAAALGVPVVLHPPTEAPSSQLFTRMPKLKMLGRAIDTTVTAASLITSGVLDRFPDLQLVLVHGGGFLPYQVGRLDQVYELEGGTLPSEYARRMNYDSTLLSAPGVRMLLDFVGAERLMVGLDYAATPTPEVWDRHPLTANVLDAGADQSDTKLVLRGNAERLFAIP